MQVFVCLCMQSTPFFAQLITSYCLIVCFERFSAYRTSQLCSETAIFFFSKSSTALSTSERLQAENRQMEMRLQELKSSLKKRKEQRKAPGVIWRSGKSGAIKSHVSEILKHSTARRQQSLRKVKVLGSNNNTTGRPQPPPQGSQVRMGIPSPSDEEPSGDAGSAVMWNPSSSETAPAGESQLQKNNLGDDIGMSVGTDKGPQDETYDEHASHASFLEALNEWRLGRATDAVQTMSTPSQSVTLETKDKEPASYTTGGGGALLDGEYDESGGLASFREAVNAWRVAGEEPSCTRTTCCTTTDTGTDGVGVIAPPVEVVFTKTSTLSLVERMMLGRARKDPIAASLPPSVPPASDSDHRLKIEEVYADDCFSDDEGNAAVEYAVDEPSDDNSDVVGENGDEGVDAIHDDSGAMWHASAVITPEFSPDPSPLDTHSSALDITHGDDDGGETSVPSEESLTVGTQNSTVVHGATSPEDLHGSGGEAVVVGKFHETGDDVDSEKRKSIITPVSLMHDFEEMEKSFTEES